jgi:hypothetical protein
VRGDRSGPSLNRPTTRPATRPGGSIGASRPGGANLGDRTPGNLGGRTPGAIGDRGPGTIGNRTVGDRTIGDRNIGNRTVGDRTIGDRNFNREGDRSFNRDIDRNVTRNFDRNVNRDWNRTINVGDVNLRPGWARPGWGYARPWNHGWYGGWSTPTWGWWGARAAAWGVGTLATAAIINSAVNNAVDSNVTYIVVPNSAYQLQYGTVEPYPAGTVGVRFVATQDGISYQLSGDCQKGYLNGREPTTAAEAELVNAACQVAFGSV